MMPQFGEHDLSGELVFDRFIGSDGTLVALQRSLVELAPEWSSRLLLWRRSRDRRAIDVSQPDALKSAVLAAVGERGKTYRELVARHGQPPRERLAGSGELRGAGPELVVVVSLDQAAVTHLRNKKKLGNTIALQIRRPKVERRRGDDWLRETFEVLCSRLSPVWGYAGHPAEYWAKAMSDGPRIEAIGRDFGRYLPGVFWLNFFGQRFRELLGDDRLRTVPAARVVAADDGVLVEIASEPWSWDSPAYAGDEQRVRDYLGPELFFSKAEPDRVSIAPDWDG